MGRASAIRAVVFDCDDTLIHAHEQGIDNLKLVAGKLGLELPPESFIREHWGKGWREFVESVFPGVDQDSFKEAYISYFSSLKPPLPVQGAGEVIDLLSRKFVLGIVTGGERNLFLYKMMGARMDLGKFAFMLTEGEIGKPKHEPGYFDPVLQELARLGIRKEEVLFVGDSVHDLAMARTAGIPFVGVLTGVSGRRDFLREGLDQLSVIPSVMELPWFIENNGF